MRSVLTKEARIGLITIVSLVLLYIGVNYLKGINLFKPTNHYYVECSNVKGITISSPVFVDGFHVGVVRAIEYDYSTTDRMLVQVDLADKMRINSGSDVLVINTLLAGAELHVRLNKSATTFLASGDIMKGRIEEDLMQSVQGELLPSVVTLMPKIDSILVGLNALVNHPALAQSLSNMEQTTHSLDASARLLNGMLSKDIPLLFSDLKNITSNFSTVSSNLKALDVAQTLNTMNATLANLKLTTDKLNDSKSTLGLLLNDRKLYDNLNGTMDQASKLLIDLQENPKKYIHVSVF